MMGRSSIIKKAPLIQLKQLVILISKFPDLKKGEKKIEGDALLLSIDTPIDFMNEPTVNGSKIKCNYTLSVIMEPDGCVCLACGGCCGNFPKIDLPVQYYD